MKTVTYVGTSENGLYLEIMGEGRTGETYRRRTNKEESIREYIAKNANCFVNAVTKEKNLILCTANNSTIVLKDYEQLRDKSALRLLFRRLNRAPIISKNLKQNERTKFIETLQLKILYANKIKLAGIALTGTVLVTGMAFMMDESQNLSMQQQPVQETLVAHFNVSQESHDNVLQESNDVVSSEPVTYIEEQIEEQEEIDILEFSHRLEETMELQENYDGYDNSRIMLGARVNKERIEAIFESDRGKTIVEVATSYGIDPYILLAKGLTESNLQHEDCCPNGSYYNGYGVGAFQIESPDGRIVKAWNYETESEETLSVTMENAIDFKTNAQIAAMYLQNRIDLYNGNIGLALQSYNYGQPMMRVVIYDYAKQMGITEEEVINNIHDLGWLSIVKDVHNHPNNYYYRAVIGPNETDLEIIKQAQAKYVWKSNTYGNSHYLADVLSYYVGLQSQNRNLDGTSTIIDFSTQDIKRVSEEDTKSKIF